MLRQLIRAKRRQVIIDLNTQNDFFMPDGAIRVRHPQQIAANIRRILAWARAKKIHVISASLVHPSNIGINDYCLDGTRGQRKLGITLLADRITFPADNDMNLPVDILREYQQIVLNMRTADPFEEPRIERLLSEMEFTNFILIGAAAEETVKMTALGLLQRGKHVTVISDAVGSIDGPEGKIAIHKMRAKGARVIETRNLAGRSHLRHFVDSRCKTCSNL